MILRALDVLVKVASTHVPQLTSVILGCMGLGTGLLFLFRSSQFSASPTLVGVLEFMPATVWGVLFVVCGACLINTALVNQRKAFWYCLILARLLGSFALLHGLGLFGGQGIGLLVLYTLGLGALADLTAVAAIAPWLKRWADRHAKTVRT